MIDTRAAQFLGGMALVVGLLLLFASPIGVPLVIAGGAVLAGSSRELRRQRRAR